MVEWEVKTQSGFSADLPALQTSLTAIEPRVMSRPLMPPLRG